MAHKSFRISSSLFVAIIALLSLSSLVGAADVRSQASAKHLARTPRGNPVVTYLIEWNATYTDSWSSYEDSADYSVGSNILTWHVSVLGRNYADGTWDGYTNWHVADDEYGAGSSRCPIVRGQSLKGAETSHSTSSISDDPDRNALFPELTPSDVSQLPNGTWVASFDFLGFEVAQQEHFYTSHSTSTDCQGHTSNLDYSAPDDPVGLCFLEPPDWPETLSGNADGTEFTYHADSVSGCPYLGGGPGTVSHASVDVTVRRLAPYDLTVSRLEVTQGLQDDSNSIPLVRGRTTVVRAFIGIGDSEPRSGVTAELTGEAGGIPLGEVSPFNEPLSAPPDPDWRNIDDTLNFELPYAWTLQPALHLTVKVNPGRSIVESNYDNNELSADVSTRACNGIGIWYQPIHYTPPAGFVPADPSANIEVGQKFMQKIYPLSEDGLSYLPREAMTVTMDLNVDHNDNKLVGILSKEWSDSSRPRPDYLFGWTPPLADAGNGTGALSGHGAYGNDTEVPDRWRRTFAHEVGHNLGLNHPDPPLTTNGDHWFDVYDRVIKPVPASVGGPNLLDFMVPGRLESEAWISPQNYNYLIDKLCAPAAAAAPAKSRLPQGSDNLIVSGIVGNTTPATGTLDPLFRLSTVPTTTLPVGSQYCVNLKDTSGNLLSDYCFNESFEDDSATPASAAVFSMVVPNPAGLNRVELTQTSSGSVLSSQVASAHSPSVTVTFPNAAGLTLSGNQTITWTASDLDRHPLTYDVLYSRDNGATWMGVGANLTGRSYSLDFSALPGTNGASGLIKVMVSDGFYSSESISANPFTVGNKPPIATILSPSSGASFTTGPKVVLEGSGVDLEDGSLGGSALSWVSSKDGALGTGQVLEVNLSPGDHTITLTVADSGGLNDTASIQVTVVQSTSNTNLFLPLILKNP